MIHWFLLGNEIRQIIDDNSAEVNSSSSDFWILVAALKVYIYRDYNVWGVDLFLLGHSTLF